MELIATFLDYIEKNKRSAKNTIDSYSRDLNKFITVNQDVLSVTRKEVQDWVGNSTSAPATVRREVSAIKMFYKWLIDEGRYVGENPAQSIDLPKIPHRLPVFLESKEVEMLFESVCKYGGNFYDARRKVIMLLFITCGLRKNEVVELEMNNDKGEFLTVIGKGNSERRIPVHPLLRKAFDEYYVFRKETKPSTKRILVNGKSNNAGTPIGIDTVEATYEYIMKYLGREGMSPHKMRHTLCTRLAEKMVNIVTIKEIMGHKSIKTTEIYTHASEESKKQAIGNLF